MNNDREAAYFLHEVKNSIAVVEAYVESLRDGIYPYGTLEATIDVILAQTKEVESRIRDYLDRERKMTLMYETVALVDVELLIYEIIRPYKLKYKHLDFRFNLEEVKWKVNENALRTIISNILTNAIRYAKSKIYFELSQSKLIIANDGPMIEQEVLVAIDNPFVIGKRGESGLGLPFSYRLLKEMDAHLDIVNNDGDVKFIIEMNE